MLTKKMKYCVLAVTIMGALWMKSFAQVTVILQQPPPYQFKVERFWRVTLNNPTQTTYRVYLVGRATERTDGRVVEATTTGFSLPPGMKVVNSRDLAPLDVKEYNSKYSDVVKNIGAVPSGDYDICVTAYSADDNSVLGEMCVESEVRNLTQVELLQPEDAAVVRTAPVNIESIDAQERLARFEEAVKDITDDVDARSALRNLVYIAHPEFLDDAATKWLNKKDLPIVKLTKPPPPPIAPPQDVDSAVLHAIGMLKDPGEYLKAATAAENPMILIDMLLDAAGPAGIRLYLQRPPPTRAIVTKMNNVREDHQSLLRRT